MWSSPTPTARIHLFDLAGETANFPISPHAKRLVEAGGMVGYIQDYFNDQGRWKGDTITLLSPTGERQVEFPAGTVPEVSSTLIGNESGLLFQNELGVFAYSSKTQRADLVRDRVTLDTLSPTQPPSKPRGGRPGALTLLTAVTWVVP